MEDRVQKTVDKQLNEIEEAISSVSGDESFYSDHPSVTDFVIKREKELKRKQRSCKMRKKTQNLGTSN